MLLLLLSSLTSVLFMLVLLPRAAGFVQAAAAAAEEKEDDEEEQSSSGAGLGWPAPQRLERERPFVPHAAWCSSRTHPTWRVTARASHAHFSFVPGYKLRAGGGTVHAAHQHGGVWCGGVAHAQELTDLPASTGRTLPVGNNDGLQNERIARAQQIHSLAGAPRPRLRHAAVPHSAHTRWRDPGWITAAHSMAAVGPSVVLSARKYVCRGGGEEKKRKKTRPPPPLLPSFDHTNQPNTASVWAIGGSSLGKQI